MDSSYPLTSISLHPALQACCTQLPARCRRCWKPACSSCGRPGWASSFPYLPSAWSAFLVAVLHRPLAGLMVKVGLASTLPLMLSALVATDTLNTLPGHHFPFFRDGYLE